VKLFSRTLIAGPALVLGAWLFLDSCSVMMAEPTRVDDCPDQTISQATAACKDGELLICEGQSGQRACESEQNKLQVLIFPQSCATAGAAKGKKCDLPLANCSRKTICEWKEDRNDPRMSKCVDFAMIDSVWTSKARPTAGDCLTRPLLDTRS
jgi:hypothetical protein